MPQKKNPPWLSALTDLDEFRQVFKGLYDLRAAIRHYPDHASDLFKVLINNPNEIFRFISHLHDVSYLLYFGKPASILYAGDLIQVIVRGPAKYDSIFDASGLLALADKGPWYARPFVPRVMAQPSLNLSVWHLADLIAKLPEHAYLIKKRVIELISTGGVHLSGVHVFIAKFPDQKERLREALLSRFYRDSGTLAYLLDCFPEAVEVLIKEALIDHNRFDHLFSSCENFELVVRDLPQYVDKLIECYLKDHEEKLKELLIKGEFSRLITIARLASSQLEKVVNFALKAEIITFYFATPWVLVSSLHELPFRQGKVLVNVAFDRLNSEDRRAIRKLYRVLNERKKGFAGSAQSCRMQASLSLNALYVVALYQRRGKGDLQAYREVIESNFRRIIRSPLSLVRGHRWDVDDWRRANASRIHCRLHKSPPAATGVTEEEVVVSKQDQPKDVHTASAHCRLHKSPPAATGVTEEEVVVSKQDFPKDVHTASAHCRLHKSPPAATGVTKVEGVTVSRQDRPHVAVVNAIRRVEELSRQELSRESSGESSYCRMS